ncbi:hypothetical protein Pelo_17058 [Pelomyxa schiedti]|nr:hypothetical protein Pelo_17058 [Pelomyxa schiedti]
MQCILTRWHCGKECSGMVESRLCCNRDVVEWHSEADISGTEADIYGMEADILALKRSFALCNEISAEIMRIILTTPSKRSIKRGNATNPYLKL